MLGRQVDVDAELPGRRVALLPLAGLLGGHAQHAEVDGQDQAGLLRQRQEVVRRDQALLRMLPPDQGFEADQAVVEQRDDGLVVDLELLPLDRLPQVRLELEAGDRARVHRGVEDLVAVLAPLLRAVHRRVRVAQQVVRLLVVLARGDADRHGREHLVALEREGLGQLLEDAVGDLDRIRRVAHVVEEDGELVAAEAGDGVAGPHAGLEPPGDRGEEQVALQVAEAVVDVLEAVDVEEEDREHGALAAPGAGDGEREAVHEQRSIRQPGQRVVEGLLGELLLEALAVGDVGLRAGQADGLAVAGPDADAAAEHPAVAAVLVEHAVFVLEVRGLSQDVGGEIGFQLLEVLGMDALHPLLGRLTDLVVREADHGLPAGGEVDLARAEIPVPEPVVGAFDGEGVALLARLQRLLGVMEVGDVPEHALDADHVAAGVLDRRLHDADVEQILPRGMVLLDGLEGLPALDDAAVVLLVLAGEGGREEVVVVAAQDLLQAPADRRAELRVGEGEAAFEVLAEDVLGQVLDEGVVERHGAAERLLGPLVGRDVAGEAEGADDLPAGVPKGHFGREGPGLHLVRPDGPLLQIGHGLAGLDDLLLALVGALGELAGEEVEVPLADRLGGVGEAEARREGPADTEEAALAVLEVDEVLEGVEQEDELQVFLQRGLGEALQGPLSFRSDGASRTHESRCNEIATSPARPWPC